MLSFGANDMTEVDKRLRVPPGIAVRTLNGLFDRIEAIGHGVFVVGPPPVGDREQDERIAELSNQFAHVATHRGLPFVDIAAGSAAHDGWRARRPPTTARTRAPAATRRSPTSCSPAAGSPGSSARRATASRRQLARRRRAQPHDVAARRARARRLALRVSCADTGAPSVSMSSTRTSKPRWMTRETIASQPPSSVVGRDRDVVRAHEPVAELADGAEEARDEAVGGPVVELARAADLLDPRVVHHGDPVGDRHRLLLVVRDEQRRHLDLLVQPAQPLAQLRADLRVERAERLVEQQHARLDGERARQRHPLALAAGELVGVAVGVAREADDRPAARDVRAAIRALGCLRTFSPKATLSRTVMWRKAA